MDSSASSMHLQVFILFHLQSHSASANISYTLLQATTLFSALTRNRRTHNRAILTYAYLTKSLLGLIITPSLGRMKGNESVIISSTRMGISPSCLQGGQSHRGDLWDCGVKRLKELQHKAFYSSSNNSHSAN